MAFDSKAESETPQVNTPPSLSVPPPMLTVASFYTRTRTIPFNYNPPPLRMNTNHHHQYHNCLPDNYVVNPILHQENSTRSILNLGSSSSLSKNLRKILNLINPVDHLGLSPSLSENLISNPNLCFGSYQSLRENLRNGPSLHLGYSPRTDENANNLFQQCGVSLNHVEALRSQGLQLSSSPNREENTSNTLHENTGFISHSNQIENNEENNTLGNFALGSVKKVSDDGVEKQVESIERNGEEKNEKGKSFICVKFQEKKKGFGENISHRDDHRGRGKEEEEKEFLEDDEAKELSLNNWNLRPRKLVIKPPNRSNNGSRRKPSRIHPPPTRESKPRQGKRTQREMTTSVQIRPRFSVPLTKKEIEEDFIKMTGEKPCKPIKRPRIVQRQLDMTFPGLWLGPTVNVELYRVPDPPLKG